MSVQLNGSDAFEVLLLFQVHNSIYAMNESGFLFLHFLVFSSKFKQMQIFECFMQFLIMRLRIFDNIYLFI